MPDRTSRALAPIAVLPAALAALAAASGSGPARDRPSKPVVRFEKTVHDFGEIPQDRKVVYQWRYFNEGGAPLAIVSTHPSCGCTVSRVDRKEIPPGESGTLEVTFDPAGQEGSVRRTITVVTNDPDRPNTILSIRAKVLPRAQPLAVKGHPVWAGQSLLMGSCAGCHAAPAAGKTGEALWAAICAMCHGAKAEGGLAPGLRAPDYLASHDDRALAEAIAYGTANPRMPGYSEAMGGPLSRDQIASLVRLLRQWGPARAASP